MKKTFTVSYKNAAIKVEETAKDSKGNIEYLVYLMNGNVHLQHMQDDEGASRWIDKNAGHETEESGELGELIELHIVQQ